MACICFWRQCNAVVCLQHCESWGKTGKKEGFAQRVCCRMARRSRYSRLPFGSIAAARSTWSSSSAGPASHPACPRQTPRSIASHFLSPGDASCSGSAPRPELAAHVARAAKQALETDCVLRRQHAHCCRNPQMTWGFPRGIVRVLEGGGTHRIKYLEGHDMALWG